LSELDKLSFLLGRWKGKTVDQFGEKGVLESTSEVTRELGDHFLHWKGETRKDGVLLNQAEDYITFDSKLKKYIRKKFWSYGFIENGEGEWEDENTLMFQITFNNAPMGFEGTLWKAYIRRYGNNEIGTGLLTAKKGEDYKLYGESKAHRLER
jgi:hypothetical protein